MNPTVKEPKKRFMTLKRREACLGWLFVSPALIGFSIFTFGSILYSFYLSMTDYDLVSTPKWVGFDNYIRAFTKDQYFYKYFGNTLYFVVTLVPIVLALSLLLAILINKKTSWVNNIYRVALFLPSITSTVAVSMVWLWIFNPDMGLINNFLMAIGLNDVPMWLGDTAWSLSLIHIFSYLLKGEWRSCAEFPILCLYLSILLAMPFQGHLLIF